MEFWYQIKTSESTIVANRLYLEYYARAGQVQNTLPSNSKMAISTVYIHPTATIHPTSKIGPNVSVGEGCVVGKGVRLRDCILLPNVVIEDFACVRYSIIGWGSQIGMWSRIEGKPEDTVTHKRPSVTILAGDVLVHPEVMIRQCIVLPHKELKASFHEEIIM
jgi:mannose-1-phosphate guanylyltransferase